LRKSPSNTSQNPQVQVLLATYNGEKYLREFLQSLIAQVNVDIHVLVSDDGSTDSTINILEEYKKFFETFQVISGPKQGPAANFFHLLKNANCDYIALADQDDIWETNHLSESVFRLIEKRKNPALTFSRVMEFGDNVEECIWPKKIAKNVPGSYLFENCARGCTIVINRMALKTLQLDIPKNAIMHDWWMLLTIQAVGEISWSEDPEVRYRIHSNNVVGRRKQFRSRANELIINYSEMDWKPLRQLFELNQTFAWAYKKNFRDLYLRPIFYMAFVPARIRSSKSEDIILRIFFALNVFRTPSYFLHHLVRRLYSLFARATYDLSLLAKGMKRLVRPVLDKKSILKIENADLLSRKCERIAILVIYPKIELRQSIDRLISSLKDQNFLVLMVVNSNKDHESWINGFLYSNIVLLHRKNIGKDFGAYREAIQYLQKGNHLVDCKKLLIANDSVYYHPNSTNFLKNCLSSSEFWVSMFNSEEIKLHAQSFFELFDETIFKSKPFLNFWESYGNPEQRRKLIKNGELGLSQVLINEGFLPRSIVEIESLCSLSEFSNITDAERLALFAHTPPMKNASLKYEEQAAWLRVVRTFEERNLTHYLGLMCTRLLGTPLKLDLLRFGLVTEAALRDSLFQNGVSNLELESILLGAFSRSQIASENWIHKLWRSQGLL